MEVPSEPEQRNEIFFLTTLNTTLNLPINSI